MPTIADQLRDAVQTYTQAGGEGSPIERIQDQAIPEMMRHFEELRDFFDGFDYQSFIGGVEADQTARVLKSGGYGLILFGTSPSRVDTLEPFVETLQSSGLVIQVETSRNISSNRRQRPSLTEETVLIVRKD